MNSPDINYIEHNLFLLTYILSNEELGDDGFKSVFDFCLFCIQMYQTFTKQVFQYFTFFCFISKSRMLTVSVISLPAGILSSLLLTITFNLYSPSGSLRETENVVIIIIIYCHYYMYVY